MWTDWATGTLQGINAPGDQVNFDTLWAWSGAESGIDRMRWNNPLNTTQPWPGAKDMNSVGVKAYLSIADGIGATVVTLTNGYYPLILDHLQRSIPRQQWVDACPNLGKWGTGCTWLTVDYGLAPLAPGEAMNIYFMTHFMFGMAYGRPYGSAPPGVSTPSGYEPDADKVLARLQVAPDDVGGTLGYLLATPEGKAWQAKLAAIRSGGIGPDDDSAFVTKTALKTAIGGL